MPKEEKQDASLDDINVFEFSLSEDEINELVEKLEDLKKRKTNFSFQVDDDNEFVIHYAGYEEVDTKKKDLEDSDDKFYEEKEEGE